MIEIMKLRISNAYNAWVKEYMNGAYITAYKFTSLDRVYNYLSESLKNLYLANAINKGEFDELLDFATDIKINCNNKILSSFYEAAR